MKKVIKSENINVSSSLSYSTNLPEDQSNEFLKNERTLFLELSKDITKIRDKNDLISFFSKRIKSLYYFTHTIVTLIDRKDESYTPFLLDSESSPIQDHEAYQELVQTRYTLNEPFIQKVLEAGEPLTFRMEEIMDKPKSPSFLQVNFDRGIRVIMMSVLWDSDMPLGFLHIYTDKPDGFNQEFVNIVHSIIPLISNAVSNIIKNQEIKKREYEKSFLLNFSQDMAAVRNKDELDSSIQHALKKIASLQGYVIRIINSDRLTMSTYIQDNSDVVKPHKLLLKDIENTKFPIEDGLQNRVLDSYIPLMFNVDIEINRGIKSKYLFFWKTLGFKRMVGIALRHGDENLGILWLALDEINIALLQGICAQISIALANIIANDLLISRNNQQSILLKFSNEIAGVLNKNDLEKAVINVLRDLLDTKLAMINKFEDDGVGLTPFMFDRSLFQKAESQFQERVDSKKDIYEPYTSMVIRSNEPVAFNVEEELKHSNSPYVQLWKRVGYAHAYGALLKVGNNNIGTLWLLADQLDPAMLKGICSQIAVAIANIQVNEKLLGYKQQLEQENIYLKEQINSISNFKEIIGQSDKMQHVYHLMSTVAETNSTVLILGETGTGKELIARAIHEASPRNGKLMIKVNCAAMPANLIESELFGHEKGAFTGAMDKRIGKFELANNSTLFLDEIGEMPLESQVKLLRVIQEREFERIGGSNTIKVNVRIIAATNRNLEEEVNSGNFRSDLYYRLNVFPIIIPPLRERMDDLVELANFFVAKYMKSTNKNIERISPKAIQQLHSYLWPGNVRELEHVIERSVLFTSGSILNEVHLPKRAESQSNNVEFFDKTLGAMERDFIIQALKRCKGKISGPGGAAEVLGIPGNTLHSKMKKFAIGKSDYFHS